LRNRAPLIPALSIKDTGTQRGFSEILEVEFSGVGGYTTRGAHDCESRPFPAHLPTTRLLRKTAERAA